MLTIHLGMMFFLEDYELVTKMVYLKVFEDKRWLEDLSTTLVYIFHLAVNISLQNVIHTALSVSLLANLFYWQNESTTYLTAHFYQNYTSELHIY